MIPANMTSIQIFAQQLQSRSEALRTVEFCCILLINLVSLTGNLLVGIAVIRNPNLRRTIPNMYIINLAVSDFLMSLLGISFSVVSLLVGKWPFGSFVCQLQGFWILLMCAVSLQTLAVTSVNRYFRVVRSRAQYQKIFSMKTTKITLGVLWFIALLAPLPYIAAGHEFFFHTGKVFCAHNAESLYKGYGAYLVLVYVAIPLIILIACYVRVFISVRKHNLNFHPRLRTRTQSENVGDAKLSVEEINVTTILLAVVIGFLTCWTPVMVVDLIDFINADWKLKRQVYVSYTCFAFASTSINPIIYGIMNRSFRTEYMRILGPLIRVTGLGSSAAKVESVDPGRNQEKNGAVIHDRENTEELELGEISRKNRVNTSTSHNKRKLVTARVVIPLCLATVKKETIT